jgi:hypothetical protein
VGPLAVGQRQFVVLEHPTCASYTAVDASQAVVIRQLCGECFRLTQMQKCLRVLFERLQGTARS